MTAQDVIEKCGNAGVKLYVNGGELRANPGSKLSDVLKAKVEAHRGQIIQYLTNQEKEISYDAEIRAVVDELNEAGVRFTDLPEADRREALKLEQDMTSGANQGDIRKFRVALTKWREICRGCKQP